MRVGEPESQSLTDPAPPQPRSRFLKQKPSRCHADLVAGQAEPPSVARPSPSPACRGRAGTLLRKLAQIESKMQRHKTTLGTRGPVAHQVIMDEELSWSKSSQGCEPRAGGLRYLKTVAKPKETPVAISDPSRNVPHTAGLGSENKDTHRHLLESPSKYMRQKSISQSRPGEKPFLNSQLHEPTKSAPPRSPSRRLSPPGGSSRQRLHRRSPSLSRSVDDSQSERASPEANGRSPTEGSVIKSLDELFSGADDTQGTSSSSSDFRMNVLSLDDLAPSMASQKEGLTEEATEMEISERLSKELKAELLFADTQSTIKPPRATEGKVAAVEKDPGETDISEEISGSAECSPCKQENLTSAEYSSDFDLLSEDTGKRSFSEASRGCSDASLPSGPFDPASLCLPQAGTKRSPSARKITVKEVAVQTNSSSLTPHWLTAATVDWIVDSLPTASRVVSVDAVEELTTHSPAVSALNELLKQNLLLLRQFVEASRHLHSSFVALLEEEEFHYHTLEEAKMMHLHSKEVSPTKGLMGVKQHEREAAVPNLEGTG